MYKPRANWGRGGGGGGGGGVASGRAEMQGRDGGFGAPNWETI